MNKNIKYADINYESVDGIYAIQRDRNVDLFVEEVKKRKERCYFYFQFSEDKLQEILEKVKKKSQEPDEFIEILVIMDYKINKFAVAVRNKINIEGWESELEA